MTKPGESPKDQAGQRDTCAGKITARRHLIVRAALSPRPTERSIENDNSENLGPPASSGTWMLFAHGFRTSTALFTAPESTLNLIVSGHLQANFL